MITTDGGIYPLPSYEDLASFRTGSYALPRVTKFRRLSGRIDGYSVCSEGEGDGWSKSKEDAKVEVEVETEGRSEVVKVEREKTANKGRLVNSL